MIVWTYNQCAKICPAERIYVATDDHRIRETCIEYNIRVIMTSSDCLTGTDRVAECALKIDADVFINVQGDEPVFNPNDIKILIESIEHFPAEVLNGYCEIKEEVLFRSSSVPKVVLRPDGKLLYMSRAAIPTTKQHGYVSAWRQVCAYVFPRAALIAFSAITRKTQLEQIEDIEILRFLEMGWDVRMIKLSSSSVSVDSPEDIVRAEAAIRMQL